MSHDHVLKFLPPYTPCLNPIEECFSVWKRNAQRNVMWTKQDVRKEIDEQSKLITPALTMQEYEHTFSFYAQIDSLADLL